MDKEEIIKKVLEEEAEDSPITWKSLQKTNNRIFISFAELCLENLFEKLNKNGRKR